MYRKNRDYATTAEVAMMFGISEVSVRTYAKKGIIPAYRVGKIWRFDPKEIREFCKKRATETKTAKVG